MVFFSTCDSVDFHALLFRETEWPQDLDSAIEGGGSNLLHVTDWDETQIILQNSNITGIEFKITPSLAQHQGGKGRGNLSVFSVYLSSYKLFP